MSQEKIENLEPEQVQQIVVDFESEGYHTEVKEQENGLYTVIATK